MAGLGLLVHCGNREAREAARDNRRRKTWFSMSSRGHLLIDPNKLSRLRSLKQGIPSTVLDVGSTGSSSLAVDKRNGSHATRVFTALKRHGHHAGAVCLACIGRSRL